MAKVALFHSVYGLRRAELEAAERMHAAGHTVVVPDLYGGSVADSIEEGFEIMYSVGWTAICARARASLVRLPATAVLAGHSMGAGVVGNLWPDRPLCGAVVLLHGLAEIPGNVRRELPVSLHVADPDLYASPADVERWVGRARSARMSVDAFTYPGAGHFFTDRTLRDYDREAAERTWQRVLDFLGRVGR
jgi:dienelactone hydrolase